LDLGVPLPVVVWVPTLSTAPGCEEEELPEFECEPPPEELSELALELPELEE
jgi:hypothetical protein